MRNNLNKGKKSNDVVPSTYSDLLDRYTALESDTEAPLKPIWSADKAASRYSQTGNVYNGLRHTLYSIRDEIVGRDLKVLNKNEFAALAAHAYVVGYASINRTIANDSPILIPIMRAAQRAGDYFRCATRLHRAVTESITSRKLFSKLEVISIVPPEAKSIKIEHILECILYRHTGSFLPITRGQFMAKYGKAIQKYTEWDTQK